MGLVKLVSALLGSCALAAGVLVLHPLAGAQTGPTRVIDRTFACSIASPTVEASGRSGIRYEGTSRWKQLARVAATTNQGILVALRAGAPAPPSTELYAREPTLFVDAIACRTRRAAFGLLPQGLRQGGRADVFGDAYDCFSLRVVLVRLRAEFRSPTRLRTRSGSSQGRQWRVLEATAPARSGRFLVATPAGRPIAYGDVHESGRARVFVRGDCFPD